MEKTFMNNKNLNESLAPLKNMKSFLIGHEDEKLVIRTLEKELLAFKKLVDDLSKLPSRPNETY